MEKRYQIFISSTFSDLENERREIIENILQLKCFPAGMEMFPATNKSQFEHIKKVIDMSDYYVLIIAGRYGSVDKDGISYTEREFDYAKKKGIPVLVFVRENIDDLPVNKTDNDPEKRKKLDKFRKKAMDDRLAKNWSDSAKLPGEIYKSLNQIFEDEPQIGWVRADNKESIINSGTINEKNIEKSIEKNIECETNIEEEMEKVFTLNFKYARAYNNIFDDEAIKSWSIEDKIDISLNDIFQELVFEFNKEIFNDEKIDEVICEIIAKIKKISNDMRIYLEWRDIYKVQRKLLKYGFIEEYDKFYKFNEKAFEYLDELILQ